MKKQLPEGPLNLATSIDYQQESVVSRELMRTPQGNVTVFAFAADQGLTEHTSPYGVILQILEGQAEITIEGKAWTVRSGEIIHLPAAKPHAVHGKEQFKMMLIMLKN